MNINLDNLNTARVAVISDPHLDHQREFVWEARGFKSPEEHKEAILTDLEQLTEEDFLISLGDWFLNTNEENVKAAFDRIKARTLIIWGNHPAGVRHLYKAALENEFNKKAVFSKFCTGLEVRKEIYPLEVHPDKWVMGNDFYFTFKNKNYYCNHFPQIIWDNMQYGVPCLAGHSHGNFNKANPEEKDFGKMMDCGVDNAIKTVGRSFFWINEIDSIMAKKKQILWDHHG